MNRTTPIPIQRAGIVSAVGIGFDAFAHSVSEGAGASPVPCELGFPSRGGLSVSYDPVARLGIKGLAALNRMSQMAILACEEALGADLGDGADIGVVIGTSGGSLRSITDFVRSTYAGAQPHMISPLQFPNTVMNCAAAQCAIRFRLTGINSTVCGGDLSALSALLYAARTLRAGHCSRIVAGGVEEFCDFTAWSHEALASEDGPAMGEGAALFALGGHGDTAIGALLGLSQRRVGTGDVAAVHRRADIARLLDEAGLDATDLRWRMDCRPSGHPDDAALGLPAGLTDLSGLSQTLLGETYSASFGFQLAAALAVAPEGIGLLTIHGSRHQFGCALVRVLPRTTH